MDSLSMEKAMIMNMIGKTGRSLENLIIVVSKQEVKKHSEIVNFLKQDYFMTHGYANLIARKSIKK